MHRLLMMAAAKEYAEAGVPLSYGTDYLDLFRQPPAPSPKRLISVVAGARHPSPANRSLGFYFEIVGAVKRVWVGGRAAGPRRSRGVP